MAATKRNAGLTSAVPRATLNDEELVCRYSCERQSVRFGNVLCQIVNPVQPKTLQKLELGSSFMQQIQLLNFKTIQFIQVHLVFFLSVNLCSIKFSPIF